MIADGLRMVLLVCDVDSFVGPEGAQYWDPAEGGNGHWYKGTAAPGIAWDEAAAQAEALGGYLCTVPSEEENVKMERDSEENLEETVRIDRKERKDYKKMYNINVNARS